MNQNPINFTYKTTPRTHQVNGFLAAYGKPYFALFMEQGTGKTKLSIDLMSNYFNEKKITAVLLIAPNGVHEQWLDEQLPEHSPVAYHAYLWDGMPSSERRLNALRQFVKNESKFIKWMFVNVEAFSTDTGMKVFRSFLKKNKCAVIVDEATSIKNTGAKCTINIAQNLNEIIKAGKRIIDIQMNSVFRLLLTGTMVTNNPFDQYSYGEFLSPGIWGMSEYGFKLHYGMIKKMKLPGRIEGAEDRMISKLMTTEEISRIHKQLADGFRIEDIAYKNRVNTSVVAYLKSHPSCLAPYRNLAELKEKMASFSFIVRKEDCYDLPKKQKLVIPAMLSSEQKAIYKSLIRDHYAEYNERELDVTIKLVLITRLAQVTGGFFPHNEHDKPEKIKTNGKLEVLKREIGEMDERPLIVCARFTEELELIRETFDAELLYGPVSGDARRDIVQRFKSGGIPILGVQPEVGNAGYNFQISCNMFFYSNDYKIDIREQMEDRIHRDGQMSDHVVYRDIIAKGTVDERIYSVLRDKKDLLTYMRSPSLHEFLGGDL